MIKPRRRRSVVKPRDLADLDVIFVAGNGYTNSTLVSMSRIRLLSRKGVIRCEEIPGYHDRFGLYAWRCELTPEGQEIYSRGEDPPQSVH